MQDPHAQLFSLALGLQLPWQVEKVEFTAADKQLVLTLGFNKGSRFPCPKCQSLCGIYDTVERTWRHLDFFQHQCYLYAKVPRVECPKHGVLQVIVPWSRPKSGFTLLFEAFILTLTKQMPIRAVANLVREHDTRIWRILSRYVAEARNYRSDANVQAVGVDETASKRGHKYITLFVDLDASRLLFATPGKSKDTISAFSDDLINHQGNPNQIVTVCSDLSPAFISGVKTYLPNAELTYDRFHLIKIINQALDLVRRQESRFNRNLKGSRYLWLRNPNDLRQAQLEQLTQLSKQYSKTARAYKLKIAFQELFHQEHRLAGEAFLFKWYNWAIRSRLKPMIEVARTVKRHWNGILNWFDSKVSNGILEGLNSLVQAARSRARGYRSDYNFITICYLIAGKLDLPTHTV